jgi:hypothetical protein
MIYMYLRVCDCSEAQQCGLPHAAQLAGGLWAAFSSRSGVLTMLQQQHTAPYSSSPKHQDWFKQSQLAADAVWWFTTAAALASAHTSDWPHVLAVL